MFVSIYLKSTNILYSDILQIHFIVISASRTYYRYVSLNDRDTFWEMRH